MTSTSKSNLRLATFLLVGTVLSSVPAMAQETAPPAPAPAPATVPQADQAATPTATSGTIRSLSVRGSERLEPGTILSYANLAPGQTYTAETLDTALKALYATELFADVVISGADSGNLVITVKENPVINRIVLEGNKKIKEDKITPEIRLAPRQIFTRSKVRADVDRIIELYKREGRFAATVEPKIVELDQNRVDLVFEINEGEKSKIRAINIIGNEAFSDGRLQKEMYTKEAGGILGFFKSNDSYDPDRLAADQQQLRAFYLTQGYADFRVVSALAELTPDRRDFVITYVVEEGPRYRFGTIEADSAVRDFTAETILATVKSKEGDWFDAKKVEDDITGLSEIAGAKGYAFAQVNPDYIRNAENRTMDVIFRLGDTPRVYVERIDISGNTVTRDKVIRREFRVNEGDAFNSIRVRRSQDRIQSLGFFQDQLEIKQTPGSSPDRIVLGVDVEEKATGELQLSAGYSSLEKIVFAGSIAQRNFMGKGQVLSANVNWSRYSRSLGLGFTDPYFLDKQVTLGGEVHRRDYRSFNYIGNERNTTYSQVSTGGSVVFGFPLNEFMTTGIRYSLNNDDISLSESTFYRDLPDDGTSELKCDPAIAGSYLCDEIGGRITSALMGTLSFDNTDGVRPTRGQRISLVQEVAGLGGQVRYARTRIDGTKYKSIGSGFVVSAHLEGGFIHPLGSDRGEFIDPIRITDRFFGPQLRGFDIRGIGPRIQRERYNSQGNIVEDSATVSDALGGRAYYMGRLELELPTTGGLRSLNMRPSAYVDIGSLFKLTRPDIEPEPGFEFGSCYRPANSETNVGEDTQMIPDVSDPDSCDELGADYIRINGFRQTYLGDSPKPRLSIGIGMNWISPFGPLRLDLAKALLKQEGDDTKLFSFNVGTQF